METTQKKIRFRGLKWSSYSISTYFSWAVVGYVTYYCTDLIGLNAGIVGTLLLISKILDAITNFIAATLVDNCHLGNTIENIPSDADILRRNADRVLDMIDLQSCCFHTMPS